MVTRNRRPPVVPNYQLRWEGKLVEWHGPEGHGRGLVLEANLYRTEEEQTILLRVARDDGFIQPGVRVDWVTESKPNDR